mmetsp:Transcript_114130/g.295544  ORF Transcript_114130/g.295544 Transcript_114130/m.295544 type:complete len:90 (+) Transcript_114130:528-797(+)
MALQRPPRRSKVRIRQVLMISIREVILSISHMGATTSVADVVQEEGTPLLSFEMQPSRPSNPVSSRGTTSRIYSVSRLLSEALLLVQYS